MRLPRRGIIAAALLSLIGAAPAFARKKQVLPPPAPTMGLIDNVNGLTTDTRGGLVRFTGLLIDREGRVEARLTATDKRPESLTFRLDGKGRTLIPAFVDAQAHLIDTGIALMTLDLSDTRSLAEAQAKIAADLRANPDRKWVLGRGWDVARWGLTTPPSPTDLDIATGGTPAYLVSADGQTGWANSAALRAAGVTKAMPPDEMQRRLRAVVPQPSAKDRDIAVDKAQRLFLAAGYGAVTDTGLSIDDWQSIRRTGDRGALRLRVLGYARTLADLVTIAGPEPTPWLYDGRLRLGGVVFPLRSPAPAPTSPQATALLNQMSRAAMDGFQVGLDTDATGTALAMFAEMDATYKGDRRWRVDAATGSAVLDASVRPSSSAVASATPAARPVPLVALSKLASGGIGSALTALTRQPAYNAFAEKELGALDPGQRADFLLIDRDIATVAPADIAATRVLETWIGGKRAWVANEAP